MWISKIIPTIHEYDLAGYVLGIKKRLEEFIEFTNENGAFTRVINPEFVQWNKDDMLLLSWLLASLSIQILSKVVHCQSSHELWKNLKTIFATRSKAKILPLKFQLQNTIKGFDDYFRLLCKN